MSAVSSFLDILATGPKDAECVFNPWRDHDERDAAPRKSMPSHRLDNMGAYLEARTQSARVLLLGEAPSHRGCRFSGIAFCSEVELLHKRDLVAQRPLQLTSAVANEKPMRERSAAIIWDEMDRAGCARQVVLWNAFPWHPYLAQSDAPGPSGPSSNRRPKRTEVVQGRPALDALLSCFTHNLLIYAVGKVAEELLRDWDEARCAGYVRHPSMGGESKFRSQFQCQIVAHL